MRRSCPGIRSSASSTAAAPGATRFTEGDRVGIAWLRSTCGTCRYCRAGNENLCPQARFTGYHANGGYAEYAVVREDFAYASGGARRRRDDAAAVRRHHRLPRAAPRRHAARVPAGSLRLRLVGAHRDSGGAPPRLYGVRDDARCAHQQLARALGAAWAGDASATPPEKLDSAVLFAPAGELVLPALEALDSGGTLALAGIYLTDIPVLNYERHLFHEKICAASPPIPVRTARSCCASPRRFPSARRRRYSHSTKPTARCSSSSTTAFRARGCCW